MAEHSVGATLWKHIELFKPKLNIVENPSVGELTAPAGICELIDFALGTMLQVVQNRNSGRVRVYCTVDDRQNLVLGVADDGPWYNISSQVRLSEICQWVYNIGGEYCLRSITGKHNEVAVQLSVPLSRR
jgi:hypothetical protein